jgi:uncharacterized protein (DUF1330 family)
MAKGYWVARIDVADPVEYQKYVAASAAAFKKYGGVALARGGRAEVMEGAGRGRNVIWEFATFQDAVDCYRSPEYRAAKALREPVAVGDVIVVEGVDH